MLSVNKECNVIIQNGLLYIANPYNKQTEFNISVGGAKLNVTAGGKTVIAQL
jgi:hypothetical protein